LRLALIRLVAVVGAIGPTWFRRLAAEVEARLFRIAHRPGAGLGSAMGARRRIIARLLARNRRRAGRHIALMRLLRHGTLQGHHRLGLRRHGAARNGTTLRNRGAAGIALDRRGPAGEAETVRLADYRISRNPSECYRNLTGGLALPPKPPQHLNSLFGPFHTRLRQSVLFLDVEYHHLPTTRARVARVVSQNLVDRRHLPAICGTE